MYSFEIGSMFLKHAVELNWSQWRTVKGQVATATSYSKGNYVQIWVINCSQRGRVCGGEGQKQAIGLQDLQRLPLNHSTLWHYYVRALSGTAFTVSLCSPHTQHTQARSSLLLLPLQGLSSAAMRAGYKSGGLLSALCATSEWERGALKKGSRRKRNTCWKRSAKQRVWSISNIAYVCKRRTVSREPMFLAQKWSFRVFGPCTSYHSLQSTK